MIIHVVKSGETVQSIASEYGVSAAGIQYNNGLEGEGILVPGQALIIQFPETVYVVQQGDTLYSIAQTYGLSVIQLMRNNFRLGGRQTLYPGETLVITYKNQPKRGSFRVNSYAYPYIQETLMRQQLPYLTYLTPFTYGITEEASLVPLDDEKLIALSKEYDVSPLMHLSTLTEQGGFSNDRASLVLRNEVLAQKLTQEIIEMLEIKGYTGLDVDFEFLYPEERYDYVNFLQNLRLQLNPRGYSLFSALAPKTSDTQRGVLYEGHDYAGIGSAVNYVLLMTYEWGYTYGPPMAVAPINQVRGVVEYALTRIASDKLFLGVPTYGYDWTLPFVQGGPGAPSISPIEATRLAAKYNAEIQYDETAQSPWFQYTDENARLHEVWFEDARSIQAKLELAKEYNMTGIGYWNSMRPFPQNWVLLNAQYNIVSL